MVPAYLAVELQFFDLDLGDVFLVEQFFVPEQVEHALICFLGGLLLLLRQPLGRLPIEPLAEVGFVFELHYLWLQTLRKSLQLLLHGYPFALAESSPFYVLGYLFEGHHRRVLIVLRVVD